MGMFNGDINNGHQIKKRIAELKHELHALKSGTSNFSDAHFNAGEIAGTLKEKGREAYQALSQHTDTITTKAKQNPKAALAVLGGIGLLAGMLYAKQKKN